MRPPYRFHAARYVCPDCDGPTEEAGGHDHILKVRCQDCDWVETFDPAADKFASDELDRETTDIATTETEQRGDQ